MTRLAIAALLALAACAAPPDGDDRGGSVLAYAASIAAHDGPVAVSGYCSSACVMWLAHENACVAPPATFGFHTVERDATGLARRVYEDHLRRADPGLLAWYQATAADSATVVRLSGARLIAEGWAEACP